MSSDFRDSYCGSCNPHCPRNLFLQDTSHDCRQGTMSAARRTDLLLYSLSHFFIASGKENFNVHFTTDLVCRYVKHLIPALCLIRYKTEDTKVFFWHQEAFSPACIWATASCWNLCLQMLRWTWITKICLSPRVFWWISLLLSFLVKIFYSLRNSKKPKQKKNKTQKTFKNSEAAGGLR